MIDIEANDNLNNNKVGKTDTEDTKVVLKDKNNSGQINQQVAGGNLVGRDQINNNPTEISVLDQIIDRKAEYLARHIELLKIFKNCGICMAEAEKMFSQRQKELWDRKQQPIKSGGFNREMGIKIIHSSSNRIRVLENEIEAIEKFSISINCSAHSELLIENVKILGKINDYETLIRNFKA